MVQYRNLTCVNSNAKVSSRQESCKLLLCLVHVESYLMKPRMHARTHARTHTRTHAHTHTVPYLVCLGGGVESHSEEWSPLLALVPLLREAPTARGRVGRGGEGRVK